MPFLSQKYSHSVLCRSKSLTNKCLDTYQLVIRTAPFSESTLHRSDDFVFLQIPREPIVNQALHNFTDAAC